MILLGGVLESAQSASGGSSNPADDAEKISVRPSGDFNVLSPSEVLAVAAATHTEQDAALITVAAFAGLRLGELRALRWSDVDFALH